MSEKRNSIKINSCLIKPIQNRDIFVSIFKQLFIALSISFISLFTFLSITSFLEKKPITQLSLKTQPTTSLPNIQVLGEETQNPPNLPLEKGGATDQFQSTPTTNNLPLSQRGIKGVLAQCKNCIQPKHIQNNSISSNKIKNKSLLSEDIASNQINSRTIEDLSIQEEDLSNSLQSTINQAPLFSRWNKSSGIEITESQITDLQNYLTSYSETDPIFSIHSASGITSTNITNWNTAYSWGNHAIQNYITDGNTNWNNEYNFITASTSDTLTNKSGNISMWTNNSNYITDGNTNWNNEYSFITNLSSFTTDNLNQGTTNFYTQWTTNGTTISYSNNVGIGTTTPTESLHLSGNIRSNNYIGSGNRCVYVDLNGVLRVKSEDCGTSSGGDNLGNHTLTQNIIMGNNWISGDGDNEGFQINSTGILSGAQGNISMWTNDSNYITDGNTNWNNEYSFITTSTTDTLTNKSGNISMWTNNTGYLTSYTETDPVFTAWNKSTGITITESQISNLQSYLINYTETDPVFTAHQANNITASHLTILGNTSNTNTGDNATNSQYSGLVTMTYPTIGIPLSTGSTWGTSITNNSANWNTAYGWGNYAQATTYIGTTAISLNRSSLAQSLTGITSIDGSAGTLTTARTIAGVSFDGSANISIASTNLSDTTNLARLDAANAFSSTGITSFAGNVGIGTTDPLYSLHLKKTNAGYARVYAENTSNADTSGAIVQAMADVASISISAWSSGRTAARFGVTIGGWSELLANTGNGMIVGTTPSTPLVFGTNSLERMRIDSTGNIGIGTMVPAYKLEVNGGDISINNSGGTLRFYSGATQQGYVNVGGSAMYIEAISRPLSFKTGGGIQMTIDNSGNVGIGTTSPGRILHVRASSANSQFTSTGIANAAIYLSGTASASIDNQGITSIGDDIGIMAGGDSRLVVKSSGNVGIGTTSPAAPFNVYKDAGAGALAYFQSLNADGYGMRIDTMDDGNDKYAFRVTSNNTATIGLTVQNSGNVGIGTTSPGANLHIYKTITVGKIPLAIYGAGIDGMGGNHQLLIERDMNSAGGIILQTQSQIDSGDANVSLRPLLLNPNSGSVGIGTTNPTNLNGFSGALSIVSTTDNSSSGYVQVLKSTWSSTSARQWVVFLRYDGTQNGWITSYSGNDTTYNSASDERLKENITNSTIGLNTLMNMKVRNFNWISDLNKTDVQGFIAQELYEIYPEAVSVGGDDLDKNPWGVDYGKLTPILTKAVQELNLKKADLTLLTTNQQSIDQNFNLISNRITALENPLTPFIEGGGIERIDTIETDLSQLTINTQQQYNTLSIMLTDHEKRIQDLEGLVAEINTPLEAGAQLSVELEAWDGALNSLGTITEPIFELDGEIRIKNKIFFEKENGVIMKSSGGKCFEISVDDEGNLGSQETTCPENP